jgi:hypothetical protein
MKIQVIKRGSKKAEGSDPCPFLIEVPPEAAKK